MQIVGMLDSPYVRRVAIAAQCLSIDYEHRPLSIFHAYEEFRQLNPLVKVPTLICDDGEMLVDSTLIVDYLQTIGKGGRNIYPSDETGRRKALQLNGISLVAMEKLVQIIYETRHRPEEYVHQPWIDRVMQQLRSGLEMLEGYAGDGESWFFGDDITLADISVAVAWSFCQLTAKKRIAATDFPGLSRFSERAEALPEFIACPIN